MAQSESAKIKYIRIEEVAMGMGTPETELQNKIAEILEINPSEILKYTVAKRAVDSRNKRKILFVYSLNVSVDDPENFIKKFEVSGPEAVAKTKRHRIKLFEPYVYEIKSSSLIDSQKHPVIVGSGPSGLFCALVLAKSGLKPLLIERGKDVDSRIKDVDLFFGEGKLNPSSNVQFGEGGAGTFSDGKLYTLINNPRSKYVFEEFIKHGAPAEIARDAKPHIGTDNLRSIVKNIRQEIINLGGEVRFETCLTGIESSDGRIKTAILNDSEKISVDDLIIATGHSARDTYKMLHENNLEISAKPFSMGLRIEHEADMINQSQYGDFYKHTNLPSAEYKLVAHLPKNRSVYTFCMCPGGYVVAAASEEGGLVVNGMSQHERDGANSNSALLVNVMPEDFGSDHPLAGIEFQRKWEQKAFTAGGSNYHAPVQLVGNFLEDGESEDMADVTPTYKPGFNPTSLSDCLPDFIINSIREALPILERKIKGFSHYGAVLTGVETRSSSPVRLFRDETFQSNIQGIYPAGEGAGYAGGIVSSAIDGMKVAEAIIEKHKK